MFSVFPVPKQKKFNDQPFAYHAEIELEISTLTNLGSGLGRVALPAIQNRVTERSDSSASKTDNPAGWVVMVPFTLPGERVRARIFRNHKNYSEADLVAVLTPSPHRVAPRCALFARCGGCQYQHFAYAEQLAWKRRQVAELLQHMAGVTFPVAPVIGSPREFGYRSKITPHFATAGGRAGPLAPPPPETGGASGPALPTPIGFLRQGTRFDIVDVPRCEIATDAINEKLPEVRTATQKKIAAGEYARGATLLLRHAQAGVTTDYDAIITEEIALESPPSIQHSALRTPYSLRLRFLARDFFQNNPFILPAFTGYVRTQAAGGGARFLVDAYCGSGLFALACAPAFERVAGVEVSESSVRFARENAAANGIAHTTFLAADASAIFAGLDFPPADTAVIIDPPRKGCDESFLAQLFAYGPRTVVYVSCDPATQMRDLKQFLAAGYALTAVQPFDLFPQTRHLECVITLRRKTAA